MTSVADTGAPWLCRVCGADVAISDWMPWRCPNASAADPRHVLSRSSGVRPLQEESSSDNPFLAYRSQLWFDACAAANGLTDDERIRLIADVDRRIAAVAGHGFRMTPFARHEALSEALGFSDLGGVWVKDETGNVGGSHKARHLMSTLLHLVGARQAGVLHEDPTLAIASCGNAAVAAATLAASVGWSIQVFVPEWASGQAVAELDRLGAAIVRCPRLPSDPPGDPCVHRFREAVAAGAVPFTVQGPENATCLDGGRSIGWEMARQITLEGGPSIDRIYVQTGAGALISGVGAGFFASGLRPPIYAVQTAACAPLERAWQRVDSVSALTVGARWREAMWPWEHVGTSAADGILDDETYDWLGAFDAMRGGGGAPVLVDESLVTEALNLAQSATSINVSATGAAGLAGVLADRRSIGAHKRIAVIFSGVDRHQPDHSALSTRRSDAARSGNRKFEIP